MERITGGFKMTRASSLSRLLGMVAVGASTVFAGTLSADPPARVGRLNYMNGAVSMRPAGSDDWVAAVPNRPLTTGDKIWTDNDSRAEMHVGSTVIRIDAQTELDLTAVDDNILQMRLAQGSMNIVVRHLNDGEDYEIDTPNGAVSIGRSGEYRIDAGPDGTTSVVTVWTGSVEVTSAGSSFAVNPRQQAAINGTDSPTYNLVDAPAYDAWDQWCVGRDQRDANSQSARYVSTEMTGYEDLDTYGHWQTVPGYGPVWYPNAQPAGWAPYHTGHWVWVDPWGWTWIDDAPWGYAPYHYGRWVNAGGYWGWVPGEMVPHPVYAPALVAFVGAPGPRPGFTAGVAIGVGATVAWFALGPQEVYHPAYVTSPRYVQQVNVTNVTNVTNITNVTNTTNITNVQYRNREVPGAMAATTSTAFGSARPVQSAPVPITTAMRSAPVTGMAPAVVPTRASLAAAPEGGRALVAPPASIQNRAVVAKMAPPPPPVPFAAKQQALAANGGRPLNPSQETAIRQSHPAFASANQATYKPAAHVPAGGGLKAATATAGDRAPAYHLASQPTHQAAPHPVGRGTSSSSAGGQGGGHSMAQPTHTNSTLAGGTPSTQATNSGGSGNNGGNGNKPANNNGNNKNPNKAHNAPQHEPAEKPAKEKGK
jgi:hypothetical protein